MRPAAPNAVQRERRSVDTRPPPSSGPERNENPVARPSLRWVGISVLAPLTYCWSHSSSNHCHIGFGCKRVSSFITALVQSLHTHTRAHSGTQCLQKHKFLLWQPFLSLLRKRGGGRGPCRTTRRLAARIFLTRESHFIVVFSLSLDAQSSVQCRPQRADARATALSL